MTQSLQIQSFILKFALKWPTPARSASATRAQAAPTLCLPCRGTHEADDDAVARLDVWRLSLRGRAAAPLGFSLFARFFLFKTFPFFVLHKSEGSLRALIFHNVYNLEYISNSYLIRTSRSDLNNVFLFFIFYFYYYYFFFYLFKFFLF